MIEAIRSKLPEIQEICRRRGVRKLFLFGSAAGDRFNAASSDVDLLVVFEEREAVDEYFRLLDDLTRLFERPVDLVEACTLRNPYLIASINRTKQVLYAA